MEELKDSKPWLIRPGDGFWLSVDDRVYKVRSTHIAAICASPGQFDVELNHVRAVFARHQEPIPHEGYAREELIIEVIRQHRWIRLRHHIRRGWNITVPDLGPEITQRLRRFFANIYLTATGNDQVFISAPEGIAQTTTLDYKKMLL